MVNLEVRETFSSCLLRRRQAVNTYTRQRVGLGHAQCAVTLDWWNSPKAKPTKSTLEMSGNSPTRSQSRDHKPSSRLLSFHDYMGLSLLYTEFILQTWFILQTSFHLSFHPLRLSHWRIYFIYTSPGELRIYISLFCSRKSTQHGSFTDVKVLPVDS